MTEKTVEQTLSETLIDISNQMEMQWLAIDGIDFTRSVDKPYSDFMTQHFLENLHSFAQKTIVKLDKIAGVLLEEERNTEKLQEILDNQELDSNTMMIEKVYQAELDSQKSHFEALTAVYLLGKMTGTKKERQKRTKA